MSVLRRVMVVLVVVCLLGGYSSVCWAAVYDWYMPQPMASSEAAIARIKELSGSLRLDANVSITDLRIDKTGLYIFGVGKGDNNRFSLPFGQLERFSYMYDPEGRTYGFMDFWIGSPELQTFWVDSRTHGRGLLDAVVTLALAQQASLDPYYYFEITIGSAGYINKVLKMNNLSSGAVVHSGDPQFSPLNGDDVIVQAAYAGKIVPIKDKEAWWAATRDAIAGKPEETMQVRFVRKGVAMEKAVKLIAYGYNTKINQGDTATPSGSSAPSTPPKGFGVDLRMMDASELKAVGLDRTVGFLVLSVAKESIAEKMQIKANDVLLAINAIDISSAQQLIELMGKGPILSVKVWRDGATVMSQPATLTF
ncbi:MAG TPA: PDZ domain-containing protein [Negativicutes bacterium]|nr:PDZ domain-containing protein [Negativicutes bacterium]